MQKAKAFAIARDGVISIRSVSTTARAAMVNWLVTDAGCLVTQSWDDEMIRSAFHRQAERLKGSPPRAIEVVEVDITVAKRVGS